MKTTIINTIKANIETRKIKLLRNDNDRVANNIARDKSNENFSTTYIFIPDRNEKGRVSRIRKCNLMHYYEHDGSLLSLFSNKPLDEEVWNDAHLSFLTFQGQVYRLSFPCTFIPELVWDSNAERVPESNVQMRLAYVPNTDFKAFLDNCEKHTIKLARKLGRA